MGKEFAIEPKGIEDGELVLAGPSLPGLRHQLLVPRTLRRTVDYGRELPTVSLTLTFEGERFEITELLARSRNQTFISTQFLTHLSLPKVIAELTRNAIPKSETWAELGNGIGLEDDEFITQLYWFSHVTWGTPRADVMTYTGWSRANTNWHLRRLSKKYPLPLQESRVRHHEKKAGSEPDQTPSGFFSSQNERP